MRHTSKVREAAGQRTDIFEGKLRKRCSAAVPELSFIYVLINGNCNGLKLFE
jgi:hypothetical protein